MTAEPEAPTVENAKRDWRADLRETIANIPHKTIFGALLLAWQVPNWQENLLPKSRYLTDFFLRIPRNFMRALCSCDLEVPTAMPNIFAISS